VSTTIVNQNYGPGAHEVIWRVKGQTRVRSIGMSDDETNVEQSIADRWGVPVENVEIVPRGSITLTHRAFERSHGKRARGRGTWAFQQTRSDLAFEHDRHGEIVWGPPGATLTEARRALEAHGHTGLWAVMP
jgi:hypothetical protein